VASSPLLEKVQDGRTALGLYVNSADMVDLCGYLGFDWFGIDQMFTANDWGRTEDLIRAGEAAGITPVVRVQSSPWLGYDHRIAVELSRAFGIGAQFAFVSYSGKKEIDECIEVAKDWHRKVLIIHPYSDFEDWVRVHAEQTSQRYLIPQPETPQALDDLEAIIAEPGIRIFFIAMTDASRVLTKSHTPDWYHQKLWEYVDRAVELGKEHGVTIGANTSYAYSLDELQKRIRKLDEHGVKMIMVQSANFLYQVAMTGFLRDLRPILA